MKLRVTTRLFLMLTSALATTARAEQYDCTRFADYLDACMAHTCHFVHPMTGQLMQRQILGPSGAHCSYVEQMPNNGRMTCSFDESTRRATARYHRQIGSASSYGATHSTDLGSGQSQTSHRMNGQNVQNPLQHALNSGQCQIAGYGQQASQPRLASPPPPPPTYQQRAPAAPPVQPAVRPAPSQPNPVVEKVEEKGQRQVNRQSNRAEREIDRQVDKVFDRLWD